MNSPLYPLCDWLLKSAIVLALAAAFARGIHHRSAARRNLVWLTALIILLILPLTQLATPLWSYSWQPTAQPQPPIVSTGSEVSVVAETDFVSKSVPETGLKTTFQAAPFEWPHFFFGLWLTGVVALLIRLGFGSHLLWQLRKKSTPSGDRRVLEIFHALLLENGTTRQVELRESPGCSVPMTWGLRSHIILLPKEALSWSDNRLTAAMRHELGHIVRRDYLTRLLSTLACAFYWPNPMVWIAARALRDTQEQACDDVVLNAGTDPEDYATLLFDAARSFTRTPLGIHQAVAMAQPSTLETRITAIIEDRDRTMPGRSARFLMVLGLAAVVLVSTAAQIRATLPKEQTASPLALPMAAEPSKASVPIDAKIEVTNPPKMNSSDNALKTIPHPSKLSPLPPNDTANPAATAATPPVLLTKEWRLSKNFLSTLSTGQTPREYLMSKGISFEGSSFALTSPPSQILIVKNTQASLDAIDSLVKSHVVNLPETKTVAPSTLEQKLNAWVIPKLQFKDVSLSEAIQMITAESKQVDLQHQGVVIETLDLPEGVRNLKLTLSLNQIPLMEALKYITSLSGTKIQLRKDTILIVSPAPELRKPAIKKQASLEPNLNEKIDFTPQKSPPRKTGDDPGPWSVSIFSSAGKK
jgi:beta-lactamase regulating signal transducer with metallopeptidase domain